MESVANLHCVVARIATAAGPVIDEVPRSADHVAGRALLFHKGWDRRWRRPEYFNGLPHLTERAADWLRRAGAALVGIDSMNIDGIATGDRSVHSVVLGSAIPIVEHLCGFDGVPDRGSRFFAVPAKVKACETFPVRAVVSAGR